MRFEVLGRLEILTNDSTPLTIHQARLRALLAVLLVNRGSAQPTARLGLMLWGLDAPARADHAIHAYLSELRRALRPAVIIKNARPGYYLDLSSHHLDLDEFHQFRDLGASALSRGNYLRACALLDHACSLWRNPELPDLPRTPSMQGIAAKLAAELHATQDFLIDARLAAGQHREAIPALREKTIAQPEHEIAWMQLMLALYRSGMRAAALSTYLEAREALRNSSGIEPGPPLQLLHDQMLHDEPSLFQFALHDHRS